MCAATAVREVPIEVAAPAVIMASTAFFAGHLAAACMPGPAAVSGSGSPPRGRGRRCTRGCWGSTSGWTPTPTRWGALGGSSPSQTTPRGEIQIVVCIVSRYSQSYGSTLGGATLGELTWDPGRGETIYLLIYNISIYLHIYVQVGLGAGCGLCRLSWRCAELASVEQRVRLLAAGHLPGGQVCLQPLIYHTLLYLQYYGGVLAIKQVI